MHKWLLVICAFFIFGCETTGVIIRETPLNVSDTRKVIASIIGQPRVVSENGRELHSKYYDRKGKVSDSVEKAKERLYTVVTILGDRRPYDIKVEVLTETKVQEGHYELSERDDKQAMKLAAVIKEALYQSQNSRNVIDDFRAM